jgi:hypothetical protein
MLHHLQWQNQDIPKPSSAPALEAKDLKLDLSHFVLLGWRESGELWEPALKYEIDRNPRCKGRTPKIVSSFERKEQQLVGCRLNLQEGKTEIMGGGVGCIPFFAGWFQQVSIIKGYLSMVCT